MIEFLLNNPKALVIVILSFLILISYIFLVKGRSMFIFLSPLVFANIIFILNSAVYLEYKSEKI